jgi:hypothetical protein
MITVGAAGPVCEPGDGGPTVWQPGGRAQLLRHHPQEDHPGMLSRFMFNVPDIVRIRIQMGEVRHSLSRDKGKNEEISSVLRIHDIFVWIRIRIRSFQW